MSRLWEFGCQAGRLRFSIGRVVRRPNRDSCGVRPSARTTAGMGMRDLSVRMAAWPYTGNHGSRWNVKRHFAQIDARVSASRFGGGSRASQVVEPRFAAQEGWAICSACPAGKRLTQMVLLKVRRNRAARDGVASPRQCLGEPACPGHPESASPTVNHTLVTL